MDISRGGFGNPKLREEGMEGMSDSTSFYSVQERSTERQLKHSLKPRTLSKFILLPLWKRLEIGWEIVMLSVYDSVTAKVHVGRKDHIPVGSVGRAQRAHSLSFLGWWLLATFSNRRMQASSQFPCTHP
jgi:hypothetical protein